jgi:hypothetical protein
MLFRAGRQPQEVRDGQADQRMGAHFLGKSNDPGCTGMERCDRGTDECTAHPLKRFYWVEARWRCLVDLTAQGFEALGKAPGHIWISNKSQYWERRERQRVLRVFQGASSVAAGGILRAY